VIPNQRDQPNLASYETYRMDVIKSFGENLEMLPDDESLRAMYEAAKDDKIQDSRHDSNKSVIVNGMLLFISIILFLFHWRWMRKLTRVAPEGT